MKPDYYRYRRFFIFLICCCLAATNAYAQQEPSRQDKITKSQANKFYEECLQQRYPANTSTSKKLFCACSASRFYNSLRQGDVLDLRFEETWQAKKASEKVLQYVYTPCIRSSLVDLLREECEMNTYLDDYPYLSKKKYCDCQNRRMEMVFDQNYGAIAELNKVNIEESITDPISAFMQNPIFETEAAVVTKVCMKKAKIVLKEKRQVAPYPAPLTVQKPHDHDHDH